jgi:hypothetical protein
MTKIYRINNEFNTPYFGNINFEISETVLKITNGDKVFNFSIDELRSKEDNTPFARYYLCVDNILNNDSSRKLQFTGDVFNLVYRTRKTKLTSTEYINSQNTILPISIILHPHSNDFSEAVIYIHALPDSIITANIEIEFIEKKDKNLDKPKFKIEGSSTISPNSKENYVISYVNSKTGLVDTSVNFRVIFSTNIGILNKKDTFLVNGKTTVTLNSSDLSSGEVINLEVGAYEYSNTSQLNIDVL